jgi:hypothetical protein
MKVNELKGVLTKEQLLDQVKDYEASEPLEVELGSSIEFQVNPEGVVSLAHRAGVTTLSPKALDNLVSYVGFPRPYLSKIPAEQVKDLVVPHLNYWYQHELAEETLRLLTIGDNAVMAIPKANFKHVKISEVVNAAESVLGKSVAGYHKAYFGPLSFQFSVLTPREVKLTDRDTYNAGIRIEHSLEGKASTRIAPYLFNQWCTNGATTEHQLESWKRKNQKEDIGIWMQRMVTEASKLFDMEVDNLKQLCGIKVDEQTSAVLDSVLQQSRVPERLQKEVKNVLIDNKAETLYDLYLCLTNVDTHSSVFEEHPNSRGVLNRVAAHLASHSKLCPVCHKQLNGEA